MFLGRGGICAGYTELGDLQGETAGSQQITATLQAETVGRLDMRDQFQTRVDNPDSPPGSEVRPVPSLPFPSLYSPHLSCPRPQVPGQVHGRPRYQGAPVISSLLRLSPAGLQDLRERVQHPQTVYTDRPAPSQTRSL